MIQRDRDVTGKSTELCYLYRQEVRSSKVSLNMLTPTEGAPSTLSDLKALLEHDNKVKVAGECCIQSQSEWLNSTIFIGIDGQLEDY